MAESHSDEKGLQYIRSQENKNLTIILQGARIEFIGRFFNAGMRYIWVWLLARSLGASLMGIFFLGLIIVDFFSVFSRMGLEIGVLKYVSAFIGQGDKRRAKGTINQSLIFGIIYSILVGIVLFFASNYIAENIFHKYELINVLKVLSVSLPFLTIMLISIAATQGFHILKYRVYVEYFSKPVLNIFIFLLFYLLGWRLEAVTSAHVLTLMICAALSLVFVKKLFPEISKSAVKPIYEFKKLIKFSTPLLLVNFLNLIMMWTDILMLGYFKTAADVGIYNTVVKTAFFINFIVMSFTSIFAPRISELYDKRKIEELGKLFKTITRWMFSLSLPIFLVVTILSKDILSFFGEQFSAGYLSLIILAIAHLMGSAVGSSKFFLLMAEKEKTVMYITVGVCVLNFILNLFLIPKFSMTGAAIASAISLTVLNLLFLLQIYRYLRIHPYNKKYLKPIGSALLVSVFASLFRNVLQFNSLIISLVVSTIICFFIYFALLFLLNLDEQDYLILDTIKLKFSKAQIN